MRTEVSAEEVLEIFVDAINDYYGWSRFVDVCYPTDDYNPGVEIRRRAKDILQNMQDDEDYKEGYGPGDLVELMVGEAIERPWIQKLSKWWREYWQEEKTKFNIDLKRSHAQEEPYTGSGLQENSTKDMKYNIKVGQEYGFHGDSIIVDRVSKAEGLVYYHAVGFEDDPQFCEIEEFVNRNPEVAEDDSSQDWEEKWNAFRKQ